MISSIKQSDLFEKLESRHRILCPIEGVGDEKVSDIYDQIRDEFQRIISAKKSFKDQSDLDELCTSLSEVTQKFLARNSGNAAVELLPRKTITQIQRIINNARSYVRRQLMRDAGWSDSLKGEKHPNEFFREFLKLPQQEKTVEEKLDELSESEKQAYRYMIEDLQLDEAVLANLLCVTHSDTFSWGSDEIIDSLSGWTGKCERRIEHAIPTFPPEIYIDPKAAYFRKILFNRLRDKYFQSFNQPNGLHIVHKELEKETADLTLKERELLTGTSDREKKENIRLEFAIKRRFISAMNLYFEDLGNMAHPTKLKNSLSGDEPFPNLYQQVAIHETATLKCFFNAGEMGSGKTGAAIAGFEYLTEQENQDGEPKAQRALILCPANVVNVWKERLSDGNEGYFRKGQIDAVKDVVIIQGHPKNRRAQLEAAKHARYVVIGVEMSRGGTDAISHEEWISSIGADYLIIDEVHNEKKVDGGQTSDTERIYRVSQHPSVRYRVLLSGTPIPNHRHDIAAQLRLLHAKSPEQEKNEMGEGSIDAFEAFLRNAPISAKDKTIIEAHNLDKPQNTNGVLNLNFHDLHQIATVIEGCDIPITQHYLLPFLYRPLAADSLPVHAEMRPVIDDCYDLTPVERKAYTRIRDDDSLGLLQKVHQMHRVCLHAGASDEGIKTGESKMRRLTAWIDTFLLEEDHPGKIVIVSPHYAQAVTRERVGYEETQTIAERLSNRYAIQGIPVFFVDGRSHTKIQLKQFQKHEGQAILVSQMKVIREGIDLSDAARAILLQPDWTRPNEDQLWRRFYRRGQKNDVQCVKLIARNTLEEGIHTIASQKVEVGEQMLNGRKLTRDELMLLDVGGSGNKANPYLWWAMRSPKEKLNMLWGRLMNQGAQHIHRTMETWGEIFAELYNHDWETSYNGNVARVVGAIIEKWKVEYAPPLSGGKRKYDIADIASGAFAIARTLAHHTDTRVWSSDINPAMISPQIGVRVLGTGYSKERNDVAAMDNLPYEKGSKDIAVLSLGLHYSMHRDKPAKQGKERMRALLELNRILTNGGAAIITVPPSIFQGRMQEKFKELSCAFRYFGFDVISPLSNRATSVIKDSKKPFEVYVFTLQKVGKPSVDLRDEWNDIPDDVRKGLDLSKVQKSGGRKTKRISRRRSPKTKEESGAYLNSFVLEGHGEENELTFTESASQENLQMRVERKQRVATASSPLVQQLLEEFQTLEDIPSERWTDMPLDSIAQSPLEVQDEYAQAILVQPTRESLREFIEIANRGQTQSSLKIRKFKDTEHLVLSRSSENGNKTRRYPLNV